MGDYYGFDEYGEKKKKPLSLPPGIPVDKSADVDKVSTENPAFYGNMLQYASSSHLDLKIPETMNLYERNGTIQLFIVLVTIALSAANCYLNFEMIGLYEDLLKLVKALPEVADINPLLVAQAESEFNALKGNQTDGLCDVPFFANEFETKNLESPIETTLRIVKASAYLSAGFFVWVHLLVKIITALSLVTNDFDITDPHDARKQHEQVNDFLDSNKGVDQDDTPKMDKTLHLADGTGVLRKKGLNRQKFDLIKTKAVNESLLLESEGEKRIRIYLRSETLMFGFVQLAQDIPMITASILFMLFEVRKRGVLCYEDFIAGKAGIETSIDEIDPIVFAQIAIIITSVFWNLINLGLRWVRYFAYKTFKESVQKAEKRRKSKAQGLPTADEDPLEMEINKAKCIGQVTLWIVGYMFAICAPILGVLYSNLGEELFGLNKTQAGNIALLIAIIIGGVAAAIGSFLVCCFWGVDFGTSICVGCVVCDACMMGVEGFIHVETCHLLCDGCC